MGAKNKTSYEEFNELCNKFNITLMDSEYINNHYHHKWKCNKHDVIHVAMFSKIKISKMLKCCTKEHKELIKITKVMELCDKLNITPIGAYKRSEDSIEWECNIHKERYFASKMTLLNGTGLLPCCHKQQALDDVRLFANSRNMVYLDDEYAHQSDKHNWLCLKHNIINVTTSAILKGGSLLNCCHVENNSGPNHPRYNHNVTDEQRENDRRYAKNKIWRQSVIKRDNLTCQKCWKTIKDSKIVAHHIFSYVDNPSLRYEPSNGITFCVQCHKDFHKKYQNGNNTRTQLDEFMKT